MAPDPEAKMHCKGRAEKPVKTGPESSAKAVDRGGLW